MADQSISQLGAAAALTGTELVPITQSGTTVRTTSQAIANLTAGGGAVDSVNGQIGVVVLTATDVSAQPVDSDLTAIAALTTTAFGRSLLTQSNATAVLTTLGLDTDLLTLSLPASTTISAFIATVLDDPDATTARTTLGAQPLDSDLTAIAALTTTAFGRGLLTLADAAALLSAAGAQAADADLTTIAGLTATTDNIIQSVAGAWASRTPAQVKAALAIGESDVTNLTTDLGALQTQTSLAAAKLDARVIADLGYFCYSAAGCLLTPNATPTKLDMAAGTVFMATTELNVTAQAAIATTIASLADATNPKWVSVELDSSQVVQFNQGTAAAAPAFPTITATRVPLGFLFVPANATNVDTLLTVNNGLAKLIDARNVKTVHTARVLFTDTASTVATNPTVSTPLLAANYSLPANSLSVGDVIVVEASGVAAIRTSASTLTLTATPATSVGAYTTTAALAANATQNHRWTMRHIYEVVAIGSGTSGLFNVKSELMFSDVAAGSPAITVENAVGSAQSAGFNSTAAVTFSLNTTIGTGNASSTVTLRQYSITKFPAQ